MIGPLWRLYRRAPILSPPGLAGRGLLIVGAFAVMHALGWRDHTAFLSGTAGTSDVSWEITALLGVSYTLFYFGSVILVPIMWIGAGLWVTAGHVFRLARRNRWILLPPRGE